jgi:hypothetical protein
MVISAAEANNVNNHYRRDACIVHGTSLRQICYPSGTICPKSLFLPPPPFNPLGTVMCIFLAFLGWMSAQIMIQFLIRQLKYWLPLPSLSSEEGERANNIMHIRPQTNKDSEDSMPPILKSNSPNFVSFAKFSSHLLHSSQHTPIIAPTDAIRHFLLCLCGYYCQFCRRPLVHVHRHCCLHCWRWVWRWVCLRL